MKILVACITYSHRLYNFFDQIKSKICYKEDIDYYNLYNDTQFDFIPRKNDFLYKNDTSVKQENFNPSCYDVSQCSEMFKKFYTFCKTRENLKDYDYVIRCNSSTFINFKELKSILKEFPQKNFYAGFVLPSTAVVSGTCAIFSKDVIEMLTSKNIEEYNFCGMYDDVAIATCMKQLQIQPHKLNHTYYSFNDRTTMPEELEIQESVKNAIIRVRNNFNREMIDTEIWSKLFYFYNLKNNYTAIS